MKDISVDGRSDLIFYHYYDRFAPKDYIDHVKTIIQYIILKKKASRIKWWINFKNILIRTGDIWFISWIPSSGPHSKSKAFLPVKVFYAHKYFFTM